MIIRIQQLLFDIVLFIYGLVAIIIVSRILWVTKKKFNEAFQFIVVAIIAWVLVKLLAILSDLKIITGFVVSLGEIFFISMFIAGAWYIHHVIINSKKKTKKRK